MHRSLVSMMLLALLGGENLRAQETRAEPDLDLPTVVIKAKRIQSTEETTAFAETLEVKEQVTRLQSVNEVLSEAVGVQVRRLGGLGAYGAASIRGSTPSQVPVYLDEVLLNAGGFATVNLGDLALDSLERIEVYRGTTPVHLGTAGIGGALVLRTRKFDQARTELAASAGSFNTFRLFGLHGRKIGDLKLLATVSMTTSRGDFRYLNRNGTLHNPDDDLIQKRQNNQHTGLSALAKLDGLAAGWRWTVANDFFAKDQGIAGIDSVPTRQVSLDSLREALHLRATRLISDSASLAVEASYLYLQEDFDDSLPPHGELGLGLQHTLATTHAACAAGLVDWQPAPAHKTTARLESRWERFSHRDLITDFASSAKHRLRTRLSLGHEWGILENLFVLPAGRLEWLHDSFGGGPLPGGLGQMEARVQDELAWQASLGSRLEILPGLTARANLGRYLRVPNLAEMFGDRGALTGNPDLNSEQGINADAGVAWLVLGSGPLTMFRIELAGFMSLADDLITYVQNSQSTVRPENIQSALSVGLESSIRLTMWETLSLWANYTYLHTENRSDIPYYRGNRLPGRPVHEANVKLEAVHAWPGLRATLWADMDYAGQNYLDPANLMEDALARLLFGLGLRLVRPREGLTVTLEIKNLTDSYVLTDDQGHRRPLRDFVAFPLPGRTIMATMHWRI